MSNVARYGISPSDFGVDLHEQDEGDYVDYGDYEKLEQKLAKTATSWIYLDEEVKALKLAIEKEMRLRLAIEKELAIQKSLVCMYRDA